MSAPRHHRHRRRPGHEARGGERGRLARGDGHGPHGLDVAGVRSYDDRQAVDDLDGVGRLGFAGLLCLVAHALNSMTDGKDGRHYVWVPKTRSQ